MMRDIIRDKKYLEFLRSEPCIVTGFRGHAGETVDAAHIGTRGKGVKSSDDEALPMLHNIHVRCHQKGEMRTLRELLPDDVLREALRCYAREMYRKWLGGAL